MKKEPVMKTLRSLLLSALLASATALAGAHGVVKPQHGGVLGETASHQHLELVRTGAELVAYLTDAAGRPVPARGVQLEATLLAGTQKSSVSFAAADGNKLVARSGVPAGAKAVLKLTLPGKPAEQLRVTLK
jgi:hypothetical protein